MSKVSRSTQFQRMPPLHILHHTKGQSIYSYQQNAQQVSSRVLFSPHLGSECGTRSGATHPSQSSSKEVKGAEGKCAASTDGHAQVEKKDREVRVLEDARRHRLSAEKYPSGNSTNSLIITTLDQEPESPNGPYLGSTLAETSAHSLGPSPRDTCADIDIGDSEDVWSLLGPTIEEEDPAFEMMMALFHEGVPLDILIPILESCPRSNAVIDPLLGNCSST